MAHKRIATRTPRKNPDSKKLPPPSPSPPPENEEEYQQQRNESTPPKRSKSRNNEKKKNENEDTEIEEKGCPSSTSRMIWKVEDETAILKGMAAFKASTGLDPNGNVEAFRDFMKESEYSLPETSIVQLKNKIRKMKSKFSHGVGGHEFKELGKKIWEPEKSNTECEEAEEERDSKRMSGRSSKRVRLPEQESDDDSKGIIGNWSELMPGVSEEVLNKAFNSIEGTERTEWVARWKKYKIAEFELCVGKTELIRDLAVLMWEAYQASNR